MKIHLAVLAILTTAWLFSSCTKDESLEGVSAPKKESNQNPDPDLTFRSQGEGSEATYTTLGARRENPFTVDNMNTAKTNLYGAGAQPISPTHRYIKFLPSAPEHLVSLEDWETEEQIPLFDFPLEYEVVAMGEYYIDPGVTDSIYTYQYASIPIGTGLPDVPFEVIDDLYLDKSDPLLIAESFFLTGNEDEITEYVFKGGLRPEDLLIYDGTPVEEILAIPVCPDGCDAVLVYGGVGIPLSEWIWECDCNPPPPPPPSLNACGCTIPSNKRNPAGCVRVDFDGTMVAVQIASIKVKDTWFTSDVTDTDVNGCWRVNESYSGRVWMWVRFKNGNVKARDRRYWLGIRAVRDYVGKFTSPPYNNISVAYGNSLSDNTSKARMYWAAAHTLNTVNDYRTSAAADGVPLPRTGLNWNNRHGDGAASAAMLQGNVFNSWPSFFAAFLLPLPYYVSVPMLPDITNQYDEGESAFNFTGSAYHELGHASHHGLVGESYWVPYRNHIINNGGYGSFGNFANISHPGHVALGEAIGNFMGALYGGTAGGGENFEWEDNFIPRGLMWDLGDISPFDIVTDPNDGTSGPDNISGFTPAMIFDGLTPNVTSIRGFRDRLSVLHLADTPNSAPTYNTFVDIYDVFN